MQKAELRATAEPFFKGRESVKVTYPDQMVSKSRIVFCIVELQNRTTTITAALDAAQLLECIKKCKNTEARATFCRRESHF